MKNSNGDLSDFYCTKCGNKGIPVWRKKSAAREAGHLKKLYCIFCQEETNFCEVSHKSGYTKEDFDFEFKYKNFENGQRKMTLKQLRSVVENEENDYNGRNSCIGKELLA